MVRNSTHQLFQGLSNDTLCIIKAQGTVKWESNILGLRMYFLMLAHKLFVGARNAFGTSNFD